jgi:hypothetical protein
VADFRRERPDVHPQLEIVNSQGVIDAIRENRSEIGFIEGPDPPAGLQTLAVAHDEILHIESRGAESLVELGSDGVDRGAHREGVLTSSKLVSQFLPPLSVGAHISIRSLLDGEAEQVSRRPGVLLEQIRKEARQLRELQCMRHRVWGRLGQRRHTRIELSVIGSSAEGNLTKELSALGLQ